MKRQSSLIILTHKRPSNQVDPISQGRSFLPRHVPDPRSSPDTRHLHPSIDLSSFENPDTPFQFQMAYISALWGLAS